MKFALTRCVVGSLDWRRVLLLVSIAMGALGGLNLAGLNLAMASPATAAPSNANAVADKKAAQRSVNDWLMRLHEASRGRTYTGTFVVSSGSSMSSSKIWHICDGQQQMERVEALTGVPKTTVRRNDQVMTFLPASKQAIAERRESLGMFPDRLQSTDSSIAQYYAARVEGQDRVAGFDADVVLLLPKDKLRYGYRVWSEKKTGLVVKLQTLDIDGRVLEQAAFSELQLDAPVSMNQLTQLMNNTEGYKVASPEMNSTTANDQGWVLKVPVAGFKPMSCYLRGNAAAVAATASSSAVNTSTMQWIFSDGLAPVSLFVQPFDQRQHSQEGLMEPMGATRVLTRRLGDWWLTVVGEAPAETLKAFAAALERKRDDPK